MKKPPSPRLSPGKCNHGHALAGGAAEPRRGPRRFSQYGRPVAYPTMQTRLNRLAAKGLVRRNEDRPAVYAAAVAAEEVAAGHLDQWLRAQRGRRVCAAGGASDRRAALAACRNPQTKQLLAEAEKSVRKAKEANP